MQIYYENSRGEKLDLTRWPYRAQTGDILDYSWDNKTNTYGRLCGFGKGVQEKSITLTIAAETEQIYRAAVDRFHEVVETDVVTCKPGKLYVNDSYLQCYIVSSAKAEWEDMAGSLDNTIKLVTDYPWWIKEEKLSFPGDQTVFEELSFAGKTNEAFQSVAQDGSLGLTVQMEDGGSHNYSVPCGQLRGIEEYTDILYKGDDWGTQRRAWLETFRLSDLEKVIENKYVTFQKLLPYASNGIARCSRIPTNVQPLPEADFTMYRYLEGETVTNTESRSGNVGIEIYGTEEGVSDFTLVSSRNLRMEFATNTYAYLMQVTYEHLSDYTYQEIQDGIDIFRIEIHLNASLGEGDKIARDEDGTWKVFRLDSSGGYWKEALPASVQDGLNRLPSYPDQTILYTESESNKHPVLHASFYPDAYAKNLLPDGTVLRYPQEEFAVLIDNKLYIRVEKNKLSEHTGEHKVLYALTQPFFERLGSAGATVMKQIESLDGIKNVIVNDLVYEAQSSGNGGMYPYGYPHGYHKNITSTEFYNRAIASSPFKLTIYGKCQDPEIRIGGHTYKVLDSLEYREHITVESRDKTIAKHTAEGEEENIFSKRYKEESIFQQIQAGKVTVFWDRSFGFDLVLYQERSEPSWN